MKKIKKHYQQWRIYSEKQQQLLLIELFLIIKIGLDIFFILNTVGAMDIDTIDLGYAVFILAVCIIDLCGNSYLYNIVIDVWNRIKHNEIKHEQHQQDTIMSNIIADNIDNVEDNLHIM